MTFLHALQIADVTRKEMVPTEYLKTNDNKMEGALLLSKDASYAVFFSNGMDKRGNDFQRAALPIRYKFRAPTSTTHMLAELEPREKVAVYVNGKHLGIFETSDAGILIFDDRAKGVRKIRLETRN